MKKQQCIHIYEYGDKKNTRCTNTTYRGDKCCYHRPDTLEKYKIRQKQRYDKIRKPPKISKTPIKIKGPYYFKIQKNVVLCFE